MKSRIDTKTFKLKHAAISLIIALALSCLGQVSLLAQTSQQSPAEDPLPSWKRGASREAIVRFVSRVTDQNSPEFVPAAERVAVFDNDGTLWPEKPLYFQLLFALDRVKQLAPLHPEWRDKEPFSSLLRGDLKSALAGGERAIVEIVMATHAGVSTEEFDQIVKSWLASAKHPTTGKAYTEMVYQPMLELLDYLRHNGFKTFIVSGGGVEFMRAWVEQSYGIPPEQVIGSSIKVRYESRDGSPVLIREPALNFIDDKDGKPIGIHTHIGRRPIAAFGNSDGDLQMLEWATAGKGARFAMLIRHTDSQREWSYDRNSDVGRLDKALEVANQKGWSVVDMSQEWLTIYPLSGERLKETIRSKD